VGTVTELYDYLRLLYARIGAPTCHQCGKPIARQSVQQITDQLMPLTKGTRLQLLAPLVNGRKGEFRDLLERLQKDGFSRVLIDERVYGLDEDITLKKSAKHTIEVVVDRLIAGGLERARLTDSLETALKLSVNGTVVADLGNGERLQFSERLACADCGTSLDELSPRMFSFNSPYGACPTCNGLGTLMEFDSELVVPSPEQSIAQGAIVPWNGAHTAGSWNNQIQQAVCAHFKIPTDIPFGKLSKQHQKILLYGSGNEKITIAWEARTGHGKGEFNRPFEGVIPNLTRRYQQSPSEDIRLWIEGFMTQRSCPACGGCRLKPESRAVVVAGKSICELSTLSIDKLHNLLSQLALSDYDQVIATPIVHQILQRLTFLINVGVSYLSIGRMASTLSGGEAQRIRLATQIGSRLTGVIYILDEPSIGLHARDNARLIQTLCALRDLGNTVVVIEHDKETMAAADHLIDMGPGAGRHGGNVIAAGTPAQVMRTAQSLTGAYLSGKRSVPHPLERRHGNGNVITLSGARGNNLKQVKLSLPLGMLVCVTGVSGSGKSSLINETLYPALMKQLYRSKAQPLAYGTLHGTEHIDKVIAIDQSAIGRTPRSNPVTYTKTFDLIRTIFAQVPESKLRGYTPSRFSFNIKGGRCEACGGDGVKRIEMHFLPDIFVECEGCQGKRYNRETLEIEFKGKSIADILDMTVDEALVFFDKIPAIKVRLAVLSRVGLGYIHLGQQATTLSGGEAQRIKLAAELAKRATGRTLYILDEPTTGLHIEDIRLLMQVIQELVDKGNSILIIEHNLDVIKSADWVIDLGPEGGNAGGCIIAEGPPELIAQAPDSLTGAWLKEYL
jgi:excinuclease ABC subunit A